MEYTGMPRILFAGNPALAVPVLRALAREFTVVGVLANPDREAGRGRRLIAPDTKTAALELGLPVLQFDRVRTEARNAVAVLAPDMLVSFACGHVFGPKFLSMFPKGAVNIHPSLLPKHRGCAPIQCALLAGDEETGITIQRIAAEIDTGDIVAQMRIPLDGTETTESLSETVSALAAPFVVDTLQKLLQGSITGYPQGDNGITWSSMLCKEQGLVDWNNTARSIHAMIRALFPWPKASTLWEGRQLILASVAGPLSEAGSERISQGICPGTVVSFDRHKGLAIACKDALIHVDRLQLAMKREMDCMSFVNGNPRIVGSVLGS